MNSTQAMRDRIRELATPERDDYEKALVALKRFVGSHDQDRGAWRLGELHEAEALADAVIIASE
jgi:hypothetical protein